MIKVGDRLPAATFNTIVDGETRQLTTDDVFNGKRVVLIGLPGAFTPTCHRNHVPGYIANTDLIRSKNVDTIAITAANDQFVMNAWAEATGGAGKVLYLADNNANFAKAIGLDYDASGRLGHTRSKRYSMLVDNGVVKVLNVEPETGKADVTSADNLIKSL